MTPHAELYREIKLTKGYVALVDAEDYAFLTMHSWQALVLKRTGRVYACRRLGCCKTSTPRRCIYMHRLLMGSVRGEQVDHRDGDSLNNRRSNLRKCTNQQNAANSGARVTSKSGIKGVTQYGNRWAARIKFNGVPISLGTFDSPEEASAAYLKKARELFGEFARI